MQDLTSGPITGHLLKSTGFMLVAIVFQTLYFLIDLYWVGRLGTDAVAGVGIAGNLTFVVTALTQMLGVGTTAVVSHAVGKKDHEQALILFNQSQVLAMLTGLAFLLVGMAFRWPYANAMSANAQTAAMASEYLKWFIPAMALQFALVAMGSALRAGGNFKPGMVVSTATVLINMALAPFLIFGWGTGRPLGVAGAALSSLVAVAIGVVWLATYFLPREGYLRFELGHWRPRLASWKRMLAIGLPAGFEFAMTAIYVVLVYSITKPFGASAQAGFGIGMRVVQASFMPVIALGFAVAPVAGQNYGARMGDRVMRTFRDAAWMASGGMLLVTILCWSVPEWLVGAFSSDPSVISTGAEYLRIISLNFAAAGMIFVASSMFQAMGNTLPSLIASGIRIILVAVAILAATGMPGYKLQWVWWLSVGATYIQLALSMILLRREFRRRLAWAPA